MKKLFTLLTMLVIGISGMWADDFTPDANAEYTLECCVNNTNDHYGFIGLNNGALDGRSAIGTRFKFESATGGYYIKVVDANKYFNWNNSNAVLSEDPSTVWVVTSSIHIPGKYRIAPSGTPSNQGLNNNETSKATHLKIGPFNDESNKCSHWTIRAITIPSNCNAYIGGVTTGNYTINETKWKTQGNWSLSDTWKGNGPGCNGSDMWSPIYLQDITSGTIPSTQDNKDNIYLEGWTFRMTANHSTFTINEVKKIQSDCYLTLKNTSVVTMNFGNGLQNPFTVNLNEGTGNILNFVMTSSNFGSQITLNYGDVTKNSNRKFNASASSSRTINRLIFSATLTDPTEDNTVESIPLAEFANNVTITNKTFNISGTDGWTEVESKAALGDQIFNGKYYYVETTTSGVTLYTYKETTKFPENSTANLSDVDNYDSRSSFLVPSGSTLIIDVDGFDISKIKGTGNVEVPSGKTLVVNVAGFDLTRITGSGTVVLDADVTLSGSKSTVATGKLIINEGKTLNIGAGDTETNSIANFTSIELAGTIKHNNSVATLNNVTVPTGKTGKIFAYDMGSDADGFILAGTTTLNGNLTVCSKWNFQMKVDKLAGAGTWLICGTTGDEFDDATTSSNQDAVINIGSSPDFTGTIHGNNSNATVVVKGTLTDCTLKADHGTPKLADGAVLDGVILAGSKRISTTGNVTIRDLAGNNLSNTTNKYALVGTGTLNLEGDCDFTKKSDNTDCNSAKIGYRNGSSIIIKSGANVKVTNISYDTGDNAAITVEGTLTATKLHGPVTLAEGSVTTLSEATPFNEGAVSVTGDATLNLTATTSTLSQAITVDDSKTLTIDGKNNTVNLTGAVTNNGTINFKNATLTANLNDRSLTNYTFTNCTATLQFIETTDEYKAGGFTITNIPSGVTVKVKKYGATEYETVTSVDDGIATFSHSVDVSGSAAWLDYTFNESTKDKNTGTSGDVIKNAGNAGESGNDLTLDSNNGYQYTPSNSYNDDGTLKVMSTPYREIDWPTNYTVAVAGNVPDVENGCLVAFGSSTNGSSNYLAIIRGASQNEIKLVKGHTRSNRFEVISTMSAANATALSHLVVFTKNGNTFTVYLDGVQKTQVTYSETLGGGFQIGSVHGGVSDNTGSTDIVRVDAMDDATAKAKVFAKTVRVYNYVISDDQMSLLTTEFPYTSVGGTYSRTISENCNLSATDAWLNAGTQGNVDVPVNAVKDGVTYYPDVEITTDAASTLTVNADMDTENIKFEGTGKLSIVSDGTHKISVYGSVTANGPISVKYGETNLSAVPVTIGESGSVEFDFSSYDFSSYTQTAITTTSVTGNASDYGSKVTAVYPSSDTYNFSLAYNSTNNRYELTVTPVLFTRCQEAITLVTPYYNGQYVGAGAGKYTISVGETSCAEMANFLTAISEWESLEDYVEPSITINQPTPGYYRFKNKATSRYVNCTKVDAIVANTSGDTDGDNDAKTIFYIDSEKDIQAYDNGAYWKGVYRMGRGSFTDGGKTYEYKHPWQFVEGNSLGTYKLIYGNNTEGKYHATGEGEATGYAELNTDAANADKATWYLIPVSELPARTEAGNSERGNEITFAPAETEVNENVPNVLVETATPGTYTCNNLQLTDDIISQFTTATNFTNTKVTYSRAATASQWGTIYLPYDPEVEEGVTYYELTATEENYLKFTKVDNPVANTPYMYKKDGDMSVTNTSPAFALGGDTEGHGGSVVSSYQLVGILANSSIVGDSETAAKAGYNKIVDPNAYYFKNTDNTFRPLPASNIFSMKAFRCYLTSSTNARQNVLGFIYEDNGQPTGVSIIESEDGNTVDVIFDLNGRRLQNAKKGINIVNGKKVIK